MTKHLLPALAALSSGLAVAQTAASTNQPGIACSAPLYDFGRMGNTAAVSHVFLIANTGAAPLTINGVDTGCGCTAAKLETNAISPGGTAGVTVQFSTAGRSGPQRKAIYVRSNDRLSPILRLELTGELVDVPSAGRPPPPVSVVSDAGAVRITPPRVDFGRVKADAPPEGLVIVSSGGFGDFRVLGVTSACTDLAFRVEAMEGRQWRVAVRLLPSRPAGKGEAEIAIRTTHPAMQEVKFPVTWMAAADIYSIPSEVSLAPPPGASNRVCRYVAIRSRSGRPFKVERIDLPDAGMAATCALQTTNSYRCEIRNIPLSTNLDGRAITVVTDRANERLLAIPICAVGRDGLSISAGK